MAPKQHHKIAKACRELNRVGISANKVKGAIKELLPVYENRWEFIEDDNYRELLEFILEKQEKEKRVKPVDRKLPLHDESEEDDDDPLLMLIRRQCKRQASTSVAESPLSRSQQEVEVSRAKSSPLAPVLYYSRNKRRVSDCQTLEDTDTYSFSSSCKKVRPSSASPQDGGKTFPEKKDTNFENVQDRFDGGDSPDMINQPVPLAVEYPDMVSMQHQKIIKACRELERVGIPASEVKGAIKEILAVYGNNWEFIEDVNYRVLLGFILEKKQEKEKGVKHDESEEDNEDPSLMLLQRKAKRQASTSVVEIPSSGSQHEVEVSRPKSSPLAPVQNSRSNKRRVPECQILEETDTNSFFSSCKKVKPSSASPQDGGKTLPEKKDIELPIVEYCCKIAVTENVLDRFDGGNFLGVIKQPWDEAWKTLKPFGSSRGEVKSMLKHLLELHDNKWAFIGDENYKALRNYFLQEKPQMKEKDVNSVKRQTRLHDVPEDHQELESSPKTLSLSYGKCHASASLEKPMPATRGTHHDRPSERKLNSEIEVEPTGSIHTKESQAAACKNLIVTECSPDNGSHDEVSLAVIHPAFGSSNGSYSDTNNQEGCGLEETRLPLTDDSLPKALSQFDIASSSEGDVKISLICNSPRSNFQFPCFDKVLKALEVKCIRPDKTTALILDTKFMEEICECVLVLGTISAYGKKPSTQENGNISFGILPNLNLSRGSITINNLIEVLPSVPKGVMLNSLSDLYYVNGAKIKDVIIRGDFDAVKCCDYVDDITRGEERVKISLVNGCGDQSLVLPNFQYIRQNIVYRRADFCSDCFGDCLSSGGSCSCAGGTGGGFAYTSGGILNEQFLEECITTNREEIKKRDSSNPWNIHSLEKFIKECWVKCGCTKKCGNRVVQRGITAKLQVFMASRDKGWGLRTLKDLPKGAFVCEYAGEVVTKSELHGRKIEKRAYSVLLGASWGSDNNVLSDEHALRLDSTDFGNVARFINHRCFDASLIAIPIEIDSPDRRYYHLGLFATRKIKAMEELTWVHGVYLIRIVLVSTFSVGNCLVRSSNIKTQVVKDIRRQHWRRRC